MAANLNQFTVKAQEAVQRAVELASERSQQTVEPMHLLGALLDEQDGVVRPLLDLMQTIPAFAYIIPTLFLFGFTPVTPLIATVAFAAAVILRLRRG